MNTKFLQGPKNNAEVPDSSDWLQNVKNSKAKSWDMIELDLLDL